MTNQVKDYVWVIAYITRAYINSVENDLLDRGFGSIKVYIPTVRILKKQFKNKNIYDYVPLLFNYGFFQIPYDKACDVEFLKKLREEIPAIYGWVSDPIKVMQTKPNLRTDNGDSPEIPQTPKVAIATEEEIVTLLKSAENQSVFSDGLVEKLEEGDVITLQGYPYDGMTAEVTEINTNKKHVKVRLLLETMITTATVSFENIFYTVYSDFDKTCKEDSIDEIGQRGKRNLDRLYARISYGEE